VGAVVMTGGGTGGHLAIIRAVKDEFEGEELVYIGSTKGQDRDWFGDDESFGAKYFLETKGVANRGLFGKVASLFGIGVATIKTISILKKHKAKAVFSVGGYSSAPSAFASKILSIPLIIHEQNAVLGSLNRLLKPHSCKFISSFDEASSTPYPIKSIFFERARVREKVESVFFVGGSQGAVAINKLALSLAPELKSRGIKIIHQAGERNIDEVKEEYKKIGIEAEVFGFSNRIAEYMAEADFAVARAGASTLWELSANGVPTIFIPYPYAFADHQFHNAKYLVDRGLAWVKRESEIDNSKILEIIFESKISKISQELIETTPQNGAKEIAKEILGCIK
jgi:UDP-N-acetylglucosamine--N-acetylmuramyl-(pentapeptide) pyrophosphoryl-undecaprenol N-acetylglucosamine transferase